MEYGEGPVCVDGWSDTKLKPSSNLPQQEEGSGKKSTSVHHEIGELSAHRGKKYFRLGDVKEGEAHTPSVVRRVLEEAGWEETLDENDWHLFWKSGRFTVGEYDRRRKANQRLNHFAASSKLCCKDSLVRIMRRCKSTYGMVYNFVPEAYLLPNEYNKFMKSYSEHRDEEALWICKPADLSRGKKIFIMKDIRELVYDCSAVIQRYIHNSMLIGDYKFDLRMYVLVTSCHPLKIHLFQDGLCRFGTVPYSKDNYSDIFAHLTNFSINKDSPTYSDVKDIIGANNKWTLDALFEYMRAKGLPVRKLLTRIKALIVLTLITLPSIVPTSSSSTCFELFGFDILIDSDLKPWLLEVNTSPALSVDCFEDEQVKAALIRDLVDLIDFDSMPEGSPRKASVVRCPTPKFGSRKKSVDILAAGKHAVPPRMDAKTNANAKAKKGLLAGSKHEADKFVGGSVGQLEQIFPFSQRTQQLSYSLGLAQNEQEPVAVIKEVIAELRDWIKNKGKDAKASKIPAVLATQNCN